MSATGQIQENGASGTVSLINRRICHGDRRIVAASRREFPDQSVMSLMGVGGVSRAKLPRGKSIL